jgi:NADH:ubiquinone oxidoreductase subunit 6 (subunit J)/NADH:ubiquinone oxidoreductase subunit 3 (subunit A)
MELMIINPTIKFLLVSLALIAGIFVIATKNAIISVFNLIVLYILVAFYLIYMGVTYLGISYIVVYIGAIAILFLFVIMMIDVEIVEKRSNNYLPLLLLLLGGFIVSLNKILYNIGVIKIRSFSYKEQDKYLIDSAKENLFDVFPISNSGNSIFSWIIEEKFFLNSNIDNNLESESDDSAFLDNSIEPDYPTFLDNSNEFDDSTFLDQIENKGVNYDNIPLYEKWLSRLPKENILENKEDIISGFINEIEPKTDLSDLITIPVLNNNYLIITPDWESAVSRITQISAIGDVLYTTYHAYIYIVSIILLLGMIGAIILTAEHNINRRIMNIKKPKMKTSNVFSAFFVFIVISFKYIRLIYFNIKSICIRIFSKKSHYYPLNISVSSAIPVFILNNNNIHSEDILGNLIYFIISNIFIGILLLLINSFFSLSVKYLDKGGGFECGFTSFIQTRERYNIIFYRVSLLFLVFDLEIILIFPYPALYQKNENISKNNVLAFLYVLIVGFIYELKEGALNIVKKAHSTEINIKD